jgi:hypothetical protein
VSFKNDRAYMLHLAAYRRRAARRRRRRLKRMKVCTNAIAHGPPAKGKNKCERCIEVHKRSR